ncbi:MAG: OmpA family protein [Salibacteraceae bacterium]
MLVLRLHTYGQTDTFRVFFDTDVATTDQSITAGQLGIDCDDTVEIAIIGYADQRGTTQHNLKLSQARAEFVLNALRSDCPRMAVKSIKGLGELPGKDEPENLAEKRRVDIVVFRPEANPLAQVVESDTAARQTEIDIDDPADVFDVESRDTGSFELEGLTFIPGRHYPLPESVPILEKLLKTMKTHPELSIEIRGHICCEDQHFDGMDMDTQQRELSVNRAKFVFKYLADNGIDESRMVYKGMGSSQPKVWPEITPEDEQANRRVEIRFIHK